MKKVLQRLLLFAALALVGQTAWATDDVYEYYYTTSQVNTSNYFTLTGSMTNSGYATSYSVKDNSGNDLTITKVAKMNSSGALAFTTTKNSSTLTIYMSSKSSTDNNKVKLLTDKEGSAAGSLDSIVYESSNFATAAQTKSSAIIINDLTARTYTIKRGGDECGLVYACVVESASGTPLTTFKWSKSSDEITVGDSYTTPSFSAATSEGAVSPLSTAVSFGSNNTDLATVDADGVVSLVSGATGTAKITASAKTGYSATAQVYTVKVNAAKTQWDAPTFSVGTWDATKKAYPVTIEAEDGATIQYSLDAQQTWSTYSAAVDVAAKATIYAKATGTGYSDSKVADKTMEKDPADVGTIKEINGITTTWDFTAVTQDMAAQLATLDKDHFAWTLPSGKYYYSNPSTENAEAAYQSIYLNPEWCNGITIGVNQKAKADKCRVFFKKDDKTAAQGINYQGTAGSIIVTIPTGANTLVVYNSTASAIATNNEGVSFDFSSTDGTYTASVNEGDEIEIHVGSAKGYITKVVTTYVAPTLYNVTCASAVNGKVSTDAAAAGVAKNTKVIVTPEADPNYELDELYYVEENKTEHIAITKTGDEYSFSMPANNVTVTATFKAAAQKYTVTYAAGCEDYSGTLPTQADQEEGAKFNLAAVNVITRTGYTQSHWAYTPEGGTVQYLNGGAEFTMPAANVTFVAYWKQTCDVTLNANGGTKAGSAVAVVGSGALKSITDAEGLGTLLGYYTAATDGDLVINADGTLYQGAVEGWISYTGNKANWIKTGTDVKLYAHWDNSGVNYSTSVNLEQGVINDGVQHKSGSEVIMDGYDYKAALNNAHITYADPDLVDTLNDNSADAKAYRNEPYLGLKLKKTTSSFTLTVKANSTVKVRFGYINDDVKVSGLTTTTIAKTDTGAIYEYTAPHDGLLTFTNSTAKTVVLKQIAIDEPLAEVLVPAYTLTVSEAGAATLCLANEVTIPSGVQVFKLETPAKVGDEYVAKKTAITGSIPANTPVYVNAAAGDYKFEPTSGVNYVEDLTVGALTGVYAKKTFKTDYANTYVLYWDGTDEYPLGFYLANEDQTTFVNPGRCYIHFTPSGNAPVRVLIGDQGIVSGIDELNAANAQNGKYLVNGNIVIVKNGKLYNAAGLLLK